jgi:hypothetical protein
MEEEVLFDIKIPGAPQAITTLENLTKANKALREERKKLDLDSESGQKRAQEINQQLDKNTDLIKSNSSALEKQRLNVGNYSGALDKLVPGLGATAQGFGAMTKASLAFIATPVGATIAALGIVIAALTQYFRDNEEGQNRFNSIMNIGSAIVGKFTDFVSKAGEIIIDKLFGPLNFVIDALTKFVPGFDKLIEQTKEWLGINRANLISDLEAENDVLERQLIIDRARIQAKIAELKLLAENRELNPAERAKALKEALSLQDELSARELKFAENRLKIIQETNKQSNSNKEALKAEAEAEAALFQVQKDQSDKKKEIFIKEQTLRKEIADAIKKQAEEQQKLNDQLREFNEELRNAELERYQIRIEDFKDFLNKKKEAEDGYLEEIQIEEENSADQQAVKDNERLVGSLKREKVNADQRLMVNRELYAGLDTILSAFGVKSRGISSAMAISNTFLGVTEILKAPAAPFIEPFASVVRAIRVATTIATGLAAVDKINSAKFGLGGIAVGPSHEKGGIPFRIGGTTHEMEGEEAIINKKSTRMFRHQLSAINQAGGGRAFAVGGEVPISFGNISRQSESISFQRDLFNGISAIRPVVTVEDINLGQERVEVIETRARVI